MNILVIGSGGREHALCWKIKQNAQVEKIYCAPGNAGISEIAECVSIAADDIVGLVDFALEKKIDLTVVGPEVPLCKGIVDLFEEEGLKIFGPTMAAARLEGSKVFAKNFMKRWNIPTAKYAVFSDVKAALLHAQGQTYPLVVKASGLAAGKGVIICQTKEEALRAINQIMTEKIFKEAGNHLVIEEFLEGEEASILAIADGKSFVVLESSQDHKRIFDNDKGPNTGGMGAYSPAPIVTPALMKTIADNIIRPVIEGMADEDTPFKGVLYVGVMVTQDGAKVLEFNTRFGDPETQVILPRMRSDLVEIMTLAVEGRLVGTTVSWDESPAVCVVMAAGGYPGEYPTGQEIKGLNTVGNEAIVFHAGTKKDGEKTILSGGRVLGVTAIGSNVAEAIKKAYTAVEKISFEGMQCRKDIGKKALTRSR